MNFLAHAYLSQKDPYLLVGNLIADCVKGKQQYELPQAIQRGIALHRKIDEFTDNHPIVKETEKFYSHSAGRYRGVFMDVTFDHFLANDTTYEPNEGWLAFSHWCYQEIDALIGDTPDIFRRLYGYMKEENWLYNYREKWLIEKSFYRLTERAKFLPASNIIFEAFETHYSDFEDAYKAFFPQLKQFVDNESY